MNRLGLRRCYIVTLSILLTVVEPSMADEKCASTFSSALHSDQRPEKWFERYGKDPMLLQGIYPDKTFGVQQTFKLLAQFTTEELRLLALDKAIPERVRAGFKKAADVPLLPGARQSFSVNASIEDFDTDASWIARRILSRISVLKYGEQRITSADFLKEQALLLGTTVEARPVYRIDTRPPAEILSAGGFRPNPEKDPGDAYAHSAPGSPGTSTFVSSTTAETPFNLFLGRFLPEKDGSLAPFAEDQATIDEILKDRVRFIARNSSSSTLALYSGGEGGHPVSIPEFIRAAGSENPPFF